MQLQEYRYATMATVAAVFLSALLFLSSPLIASAQTAESNADLLDAIQELFEESIAELTAEIEGLRTEVQTLRAEVQSGQSGGSGNTSTTPTPTPPPPPVPEPPSGILGLGDTGPEVERLQETLMHLGYTIPAGITGNFLFQTQQAIRELQEAYEIPTTGVFDEVTRTLMQDLLRDLPTSFYEPHEPLIVDPPDPEKPEEEPKVRIITPYDKMLLSAGAQLNVIWKTENAPEGSRIVFSLHNKLYDTDKVLFETENLSGEFTTTLPKDMPSDNDFIADLYPADTSITEPIASHKVTFALLGGKEPTTSDSSGSDEAFRSCFQSSLTDAGVSSAVAAEVLELRAKPWQEVDALMMDIHDSRIVGSECETIMHEEEFDESGNRTWNPDVDAFQACLVDVTDGFGGRSGEVNAVFMDLHFPSCDDLNTDYQMHYSDNSYDADFYKGTDFTSCMADYPETISLIHGWIDEGLHRSEFPWGEITGSAADKVAECEGGAFYDDDYYGDASEMYSCFYPNATIDGEYPGYTVWCEYDYKNCHEGDQSGPQISTTNLSLGAPSSCESGWENGGGSSSCTGTSESSCTSETNCYWNAESSYCYYDMDGDPTTARPNPFVANLITAFESVLKNFQKALGF